MIRKSGLFQFFDPERVKERSKQWAPYRRLGIAATAVCILLLLGVIYWQGQRRQAAEKEFFESERVLSHSTELIISSTSDFKRASLTVGDRLKIVSAGMRIHYGFSRYIPTTIQSGAGESIALPAPSIRFLTLDGADFSEYAVDQKNSWWRLKMGSAKTELPPGEHIYQVTTEIPELDVYSALGRGMINLAIIGPVAAVVDHAEGTVVLPDDAKVEEVRARGWIGGIGDDFKPLPTHDEVPTEIHTWEESTAKHPRVAVTLVAPRRLESMEGLWAEVAW